EGYPEFKGCFDGVHWMQLETEEGRITLVPHRHEQHRREQHHREQFVQVLRPALPPDDLPAKTRFDLPPCGIALLEAIPPVGSKFKDAATSGPQGQLTRVDGVIETGVSLYVAPLAEP
ncbi:MAG: hypothetical protein KDA61_13410, partial [Planctomycetales bacterium]|nr:hypothetical protein [Planctomycetales bacterium]